MKTQKQLAQVARDNQLFIHGWQQFEHYLDILENNEKSNYLITVLFLQKKAVAAVCLHKKELSISVYVDPQYRGKNLGIKVIDKLVKEHKVKKENLHAFMGEDGTFDFFKKAGIACFEDEISLTPTETEQFLNHEITYSELVQNKINQKLEDYKNNIPHPTYKKTFPRSIPKIG